MILSFRLASEVGLIVALAAVATSSVKAVSYCGETITKNTVLDEDLDCWCCGEGGCWDCDVVVKGPATMDLNGHAVRGLSTTGKGATIMNGTTFGIINVENALIMNIFATDSDGIGLTVWDNCTLLNVTANDNSEGIHIKGNNNRLIHVTAKNNNDGIYIQGNNNSLLDVTANNNHGNGIHIFGDNNSFLHVTANSNAEDGIYLTVGDHNRLDDITATNNAGYGITVDGNDNRLHNVTTKNKKLNIYFTCCRYARG